jgi:very-short-patch-repair endonuclease
MNTTTRQALFAAARGQHGVFTTAQAEALGLDGHVLRSLQRAGVIESLRRGVWRVAGAPATDQSVAMATVLAHGDQALLARSSAAWLWDVPGHRLDPIDVLHRRDVHQPVIGGTRTSRCVGEDDATRRDGIPVTTPARTIFDLAGVQHPLRTRNDLNNLTSRGLLDLETLLVTLDRLAKRGRPGIALMRRLIDELEAKGTPAGSNLELRVEDLLEAAGFRQLRRQLPLYDDEGFIARVDFGDPMVKLAIEVDSDRFHMGLVDRDIDASKSRRIHAIGWSLERITERQVWHERDELLSRLRAARARARRSAA